MAVQPAVSPGTVSKILWHFTGGPPWDADKRKQGTSPKPAVLAYSNLKSILRSKEVRLGTYKEVVKAILPERRRKDPKTKVVHVDKNVPVTIESSAICCLSDIPAPHLRYHAYRYGKFAIGFHRESVIRAGFNPVFYTLDNTPIVQSIYNGFSSLIAVEDSGIEWAVDSIESEIDSAQFDHDDLDFNLDSEISTIKEEAELLWSTVNKAERCVKDFLAFVKTFGKKEFATIYCEREWRSISPFKFTLDDIAMVVLPREVGRVGFYESFTERVAKRLRLPRRIPIVPWDDLIEH